MAAMERRGAVFIGWIVVGLSSRATEPKRRGRRERRGLRQGRPLAGHGIEARPRSQVPSAFVVWALVIAVAPRFPPRLRGLPQSLVLCDPCDLRVEKLRVLRLLRDQVE